ncbi:MAG: BspA family leucine-rich repeat surface protein, partial [Clostridia bacterium]|nr:BspA family leucine-rich repeat surface protein [Clostridia bacterium]
ILLCICAMLFACGIFAFYNYSDNKNAVTAEAATLVTPTIYWGVQGNTLVFDNKTVSGSPSGSIPGSTGYSADYFNKVNNDATVRKAITGVNFLGKIAPGSTESWFYNFSNLKTFTNVSNLDMSNATSANGMFQGCSNLESLDVSDWDVSNVRDFSRLFSGCSKLQNLDVSKWNTSNADMLIFMFEDCSSLTSLDVSGWNTAKAYHMNGVFKGCSNLTEIDVSGWNTSNVIYFNNLFKGCSKLRYADLSGFDFSKATRIDDMFNGIPALEVLKLSASAINCFKNPPSHATIVQDPQLPTLYEKANKQGTKYETIASLPNKTTMFFTDVSHTHKLNEGVPTDPTCTAKGYTTKTCLMCGDVGKYDYEDALGHNTEKVDAESATCTASGNREYYKCKRCSQLSWDTDGNSSCTAEDVKINALGHDCSDAVTNPDCTTGGSTKHTCKRTDCGYEYVDSYTDPLGHDWGVWIEITPATEDTAGEEKHQCQRDNCSAEETQPIPKLNHTHVEVIDKAVEPTCTEAGKTEGKHCSACNKVLVAQQTRPATGHTPGDAATCTEPQKCTVCNTELAAALGHDYKAAEGGVAPTCTEEGSGKIVCTRCGDEKSGDTIPALGHDWATVWSNDETNHWHECNRCDEINDNVAHTYEWVKTKDPTEEETGLKENLCTICGNKDGEEELAKLVVDDNGSVGDLPAGNVYDLEIAVKESDSLYNIPGITKGYKVELFVVDGENRTEYDNNKQVTLMLVIPEGMEDNFTLYCRYGEILERVDPATYTVSGKSVTIRTTLPNEYVFNAPAPEEPASGIPWWVWVIIGLGGATLLTIIIVFIVVAKKKKNDNNPTDNGEVLQRLDNQEQKIDELLTRSDDGGFNTPVELDENGNVIFK